jgi:hypothetical protein
MSKPARRTSAVRLSMTIDPIDPQALREFRASLREAQEAYRGARAASRKLLAPEEFPAGLARLISAVQDSSLSEAVRAALQAALRDGHAARVQDLHGEALKQLTGLPPSKAFRALCLFFKVAESAGRAMQPALSPAEIESFIRLHRNPFDLLLEAEIPSVLELGAGDLSFAEALVEQYLPLLEARAKDLTIHCLDRVRPGSGLAGLYQADPRRLAELRTAQSSHLNFRYWGNQDMFALEKAHGLRPTYTIVTCQAPPTPTVAFEPTRVAPEIIAEHLRRTKGESRLVREGREEALEVRHAGRALLFPPWKFEIRGPVAFLEVLARRGHLCVLSAVDTDVFWELLSQLLADPRVRPGDVILTPALISEVFGDVARALEALPIGATLALSDVTALRTDAPSLRFRYVEVRRGALFEGIPVSRTAKMFKDMAEEAPPWLMILIPAGEPISS